MKELLGLLQQISDDASTIKSHMHEFDLLNLEIRKKMDNIENNYRRITMEIMKLQDNG